MQSNRAVINPLTITKFNGRQGNQHDSLETDNLFPWVSMTFTTDLFQMDWKSAALDGSMCMMSVWEKERQQVCLGPLAIIILIILWQKHEWSHSHIHTTGVSTMSHRQLLFSWQHGVAVKADTGGLHRILHRIPLLPPTYIQCLAKVFGPLELCDLLPHFRLQT